MFSLMLWLGLTLDNIKDFQLPVNASYLKYDDVLQTLVLQTEKIADLPIAVIISSFLFISAIAHFAIVLSRKKYERDIKKGINWAIPVPISWIDILLKYSDFNWLSSLFKFLLLAV